MRSLLLLAARLTRSHDVHLAHPQGASYTRAFASVGVALHPLQESALDRSITPALATHWPLRRGLPTILAVPRLLVSTVPRAVRFARLARSIAPDVVHLNEGLGFNRAELVGAALVGTPVIVHVRSVQRLSLIDRTVGRLVTAFIAVSEAAAVPYRGAGFDARTTVVPNCIAVPEPTTTEQRGRARTKLGVGESRVVLTAGRLIPRKGNRIAIEAVAELRRRGLDVTLLILGDGPERASLANAARQLGVADAIATPGFREDIEPFYRAADIVLLPSQDLEGLPRVVLEGMAFGLPVVATDVGGSSEIFEDGASGLLVRGEGPKPIVDALEDLIRNSSTARRIGLAARARVEREFSCERHVAAVLDLYAKVLNSRDRLGLSQTPEGVGAKR